MAVKFEQQRLVAVVQVIEHTSSESELSRELYLAIVRRCRGDRAKYCGAKNCIWIGKRRVIQCVKELTSKLKSGSLADRKVSECGHVQGYEVGSA